MDNLVCFQNNLKAQLISGVLQSWSGISGTSDESVETFVHPVAVGLVRKIHQYVGDVVERALHSLQKLGSSPFDA